MPGAGQVGRYEVQEVCWVEPLGRVLRARLPDLNRDVYLRELCPPTSLLPADQERLVRAFEAEARLLSRTADPRLPRPADSGTTDRATYFLAYDAPEAAGFAPVAQQTPQRSTEEWLALGAEALEALALLQEGGLTAPVFHPDSLFVSLAGELRLLPLGFGHLAVAADLPRGLAGASPYAPPELVAGGGLTPAAGVFSVGAWLYEKLGGPGTASPAALVTAGRTPEPLWSRNPEIRAAVDDLIQTALSLDPARRFRTPRAFSDALSRHAADAPARPVSRRPAKGEVEEEEPEPPALLRYAAWALGLGVGGVLLGWGLGRLFPLP